MKLVFALLIIIFLAFSGYHLSFRNLRLPYFARQFYLTGTEFLFLGLLLGPQFLNLLDPETQKGLAPLNALVLGWVGLFFGFQFELANLRRFPLDFFIAAITESLLTLVLVFAGVYLTVVRFLPTSIGFAGGIALTLAAAAGCTSQTGLALLPPALTTHRQSTVNLLKFVSSINGLGALLFFTPAFFFCPSGALTRPLWGDLVPQTVFFGFAASAGLALLFILVLSRRSNNSELILMVIGMILLASGTASALNFSPLITNLFVGVCLVNLSRDKERIYQILVPVEKPAYLLLLVFLGVSMRFDSVWLFVLALIYCMCRIMGKFLSGFLMTTLTAELRRYPALMGYGLLAQGGLPLAILLDFQQAFRSPVSTSVTSVAILAIIYNEFLSPYFTNRLLTRRHDELSKS